MKLGDLASGRNIGFNLNAVPESFDRPHTSVKVIAQEYCSPTLFAELMACKKEVFK